MSDFRRSNRLAGFLGPRGVPVGTSKELTRVLRLPRRPIVTEGSATALALIQIGMRRYSLGVPADMTLGGSGQRQCRCRDIDPNRAKDADKKGISPCIAVLNWIQAWMLHELQVANGLIANAAVGAGKTVVDILAALALGGRPLCLLLAPPTLLDQLQVDYELIAEHFRVPGIVIHLPGKETWRCNPKLASDGEPEPVLHVVGYSKLSGMDNSALIEALQPDAILCDEIDSLADMESSRTMRMDRYMREHDNTRFAGWTGSLTNAEIEEMVHLFGWALGINSPLPLDHQIAADWGRCVNAVQNPCPAGALARMLEPGEDPKHIRKAFHRRLAETQGVVFITGEQKILTAAGREVGLSVEERTVSEIPDIVLHALDSVRDSVRPDTLGGAEDDEILVDPLEQARCAREVATGVFYKWEFPPINGVPQSRELVKEWYRKRKDWNSELRSKMLRGERDLDSPKLCENAARRYHLDLPADPDKPEWESEYWPAWRDIKDRVVPKPKAVRLDSFLAEDATAWAVESPGIIWYSMVELAEWVAEKALELHGVRLTIHGGGPGAGKRIMAEDGSQTILASIKSHGRGRDRLQFKFARQLFLNVPASDRIWQQALGRLRRRGQEQDVVTHVYLHTKEYRDAFRSALRCGEYVRDLTGGDSTLLSNWDGDIGDED